MESKHLPDAIGAKPEGRQVPLDRRELIKLSAGALASATFAVPLAAQENTPQHSIAAHGSMRAPGEMAPFTGSGYKNNANRLAGNGPMDDTTRKILQFVHDFRESDLTAAACEAFNQTIESNHWFKRRPAEASLQGLPVIMPEIRAWVKPQEVASIPGTPHIATGEKCEPRRS